MEEKQTVALSRCHWCATKDCPHGNFGQEKIIEGGCRYFTLLDPLLRKRKWEGKRRLRSKFTAHLSDESLDFIRTVILPSNRKMRGYNTRGVEFCVETIIDQLDGKIPRIPKGMGRGRLNQISPTLMPKYLKALDDIVAHWKGTNDEVSRSHIIDYFILVIKKKSGKG